MKNPIVILVLSPLVTFFMLHQAFDHLKTGKLTYRGSVILRAEQPGAFYFHVGICFFIALCAIAAFLSTLLGRS